MINSQPTPDKMEYINLFWVNKLRELILEHKGDEKLILEEYLVWAVEQESEVNVEWQKIKDQI